MRNNQVTIDIIRYGESVPEEYPEAIQHITTYCDDYKSIFAALSKAYAECINALQQYETIGVACNTYEK